LIRPPRRGGVVATYAGCTAALLLVVGCGSNAPSASPQQLLREARTTLDRASALHFTLTSAHVPTSGTVLHGGSGDVVRPSGFRGTLQVGLGSAVVSVGVISVAGTVYIKAPLTPGYVKADPKKYGISDPGLLLAPSTGITQLITSATSVKSAGRDRFHGEALDEISVVLPGRVVKDVLTSADPSKPVTGRLGINPASHQLRLAVLTGPFLSKDVNSTFTVVLDRYGENVSIRAPG
jgi:lipoprotein LprG